MATPTPSRKRRADEEDGAAGAPPCQTQTLATAHSADGATVPVVEVVQSPSLKRHRSETIEELRLAVQEGAVWAMVALGTCYETGATKDVVEAVRLYRLGAEQGSDRAQLRLGICFAHGRGVVKSAAEAVHWYRLAADQGCVDAWTNLGTCYSEGMGVTKNDTEATRLYRLAADQGNAAAQTNLGISYARGEGVTQNQQEAVRWFRLAADQGLPTAQYKLGRRYVSGVGVTKNLVDARKWLCRSNTDEARMALARYVYASGDTTVGDDDLAEAITPNLMGVFSRANDALSHASRGNPVHLARVLRRGGSVRIWASRVQPIGVDAETNGDTPLHAAARGARGACLAVLFALPEWDELLDLRNADGLRPCDVASVFAPSIRPFLSTSRRTRAACFVFCCEELERKAHVGEDEGAAAADVTTTAVRARVRWLPREITELIARALRPPRTRRDEQHDMRDLFPRVFS